MGPVATLAGRPDAGYRRGRAILAGAAGLHGAGLLLAELAAGGVVGWRLRFRVSHDTRAWRDGARGERATARLLRRLARCGFTIFHDVAIPGTPANADHVVIGQGGVVLVDSKRYTGRVWQGPDGRVWHNVAGTRTNATGGYSFTIHTRARGAFRYRIHVGPTKSNAAATSAVRVLTVR